jgi:methyl-accepting chemotaxis protein
MNFYLKSLNISQKLLLSILSFSIPILMLLYFTISGISDNINFARLEIFGNRLLEPLTQLLVLVPRHQRLVAASTGERSVFINNIETTTNLIDKNFESLEKETKEVGQPLKITPTGLKEAGMEQLLPASLTDQWKTLRSSKTTGSKEQLERQYGSLTQGIRELNRRVGDTSNLILDPDLDSYYLMDVTLLALPQAQQRINEILLFCESLREQTQLTNEERVKLEVYASLLRQADFARIVQSVSTSLGEDKNFYGVSPSLQKNIPPVLSLYQAAVTKFSDRLIQLSRTAKGDIPNNDFFELGEEVLRNGSELETVGRKELDKLIEQRIQSYENKGLIYLVLSLAALGISSFFVFQVSREITVRIAKAVTITKNVARGDLTPRVSVDSPDEIGQLLTAIKYMIQDLNSLIRQTQESGIQVSSSAREFLATSKQQEEVIMNQVESTGNVLKSVKEISQLSEKLVQKMGEVASMSEETAEFASNGQSDLVHMEETMQKMENASNNMYIKLQTIKEKGENITSVVTTIGKVADQTNILSLNAAIEAEKAGEYGVGFAVVAREIRRLADQTAVAALEIEQMVQVMQFAVSEGVVEIESFITKVRQGVTNTSKISAQLTKIIERVKALSPNFEGVNIAMQEQADNAKQINDSMVDLGLGMQQIKNSLLETYTAIEHLNEAAISLQERVSRFQVNSY